MIEEEDNLVGFNRYGFYEKYYCEIEDIADFVSDVIDATKSSVAIALRKNFNEFVKKYDLKE